ncbi:conserved membrane hypothetical protein [Nostocoides japonicum T1-X7]|uniref:DUF2207 domain-containing protein n=2 Tax=Nostocoides japonicum TaxID=99481 RepID=A0A077LV39_9MICO|nr:conserved membrane hypothetical protein [Tetrasphaera japonica T1-X7]
MPSATEGRLSATEGRLSATEGRLRRPARLPLGTRALSVVLGLVLGVAGLLLTGASYATAAPAYLLAPASRSGFVTASDDLATAFSEQDVLGDDGSVDVTQHITWHFPAGEERHGIDRLVQVRAGYQNRDDVYRYYAMSEVSAESPTGAPTDVSVTDYGAYKRIRIGSPSRTVSGTQQYVVKFHLAHIVNDIGDGTAEFYWNTVGSGNQNTYENVTATVQAPAASTKVACYYGPQGATNPCTATSGTPSRFSAPTIEPGDGMSVIASYPRDAFGNLSVDLRKGKAGSTNEGVLSPETSRLVGQLSLGLGVLFPLLAAAGMGTLVWQRGRDEMYAGLTPGLTPGVDQADTPVVRTTRAPMAAVQFNPPPGVQPGMIGTLVDEKADVVDVTGTLIDLAVRGYLTIEKVSSGGLFRKDDWVLRRTQPTVPGAALTAYEQMLLDGVFASGGVVQLSDLKNHFSGTLKRVQAAMYDEVVYRGWFRRSPESQRTGWQALGIVLIVLGGLVAILLGNWLRIAMGGVGVFGIWPLGIGVALAGVIVMVLGSRMAARTAQGTAVLVQSRGFEEYLRTAEASQIRWEEAQDVFSRYLPYAIVFGVADRWARVFQEVATAAAASGHLIGQPLWWVGAWDPNVGFTGLASTMDDFSTSAAGTFVSTPGSSGGSGFSAGGGFSGGGGGGSSGGSW